MSRATAHRLMRQAFVDPIIALGGAGTLVSGHVSSAKTQQHSCSEGHGAVLVVKPVQDGVLDYSAWSVEAIPHALQIHGEIQGGSGTPGPKEECGRPRL